MDKSIGDVGKAELADEAVQLRAAVPEAIRDAAAAAVAEIAEVDVEEIGEKIVALTEAADEKVRSGMGRAGKAVVAGGLVVAAAAGGYYAWTRYKAAEAPDDAEGESDAGAQEAAEAAPAPEPMESEPSDQVSEEPEEEQQ